MCARPVSPTVLIVSSPAFAVTVPRPVRPRLSRRAPPPPSPRRWPILPRSGVPTAARVAGRESPASARRAGGRHVDHDLGLRRRLSLDIARNLAAALNLDL